MARNNPCVVERPPALRRRSAHNSAQIADTEDQALRFKFSADPRLYIWSWRFLMECTSEKARRNTLLKHRLAAYSQRALQDGIAEDTIEYDRNDRGILYFHRTQEALDRRVEHMKLLESDGQVIGVLSRDQVVALDPSLAWQKTG
jgi:D-amino-acid dehydrogenase